MCNTHNALDIGEHYPNAAPNRAGLLLAKGLLANKLYWSLLAEFENIFGRFTGGSPFGSPVKLKRLCLSAGQTPWSIIKFHLSYRAALMASIAFLLVADTNHPVLSLFASNIYHF